MTIRASAAFAAALVLLLTMASCSSAAAEEAENTFAGRGMTMKLLPALEKETGSNPDAAVIWLHGLGADGHDFSPIVEELGLPENLAIRFIFPHAPSIPVTINGGYVMPAWYDIVEMQIDRRVDVDRLLISAEAVRGFVERERRRGIAGERIVIAGFSQGGAVAYQTALTHPQPLGGLLAMSTYLATAQTIEPHPANGNLAIAVHHGSYDPVVPVKLGKQAVAYLERMGYPVQWREYDMEHGVCAEQIAEISSWLRSRLQ